MTYILSPFENANRHTGLRGASLNGESAQSDRMKLTRNSQPRQAPEVMRMDGYSTPADVFSFGLILLELVTGVSTKARFESIGIESNSISSWHAAEKRLDLDSITEEMKADEALKTKHDVAASTKPTKRKRPQTWSKEKLTRRSHTMKAALKRTRESFKSNEGEERPLSNGMSAIDALDLVGRCWSEDPSKRLSMEEVARVLSAVGGDLWSSKMLRTTSRKEAAPAGAPAQDQRKEIEELRAQLEAERRERVEAQAEVERLRGQLLDAGKE